MEPPDLEEVYRPFEDPNLRSAVEECEEKPQPMNELEFMGLLDAYPESSPVVDLSQAQAQAPAQAAPAPARAPAAPAAPAPAMSRIPANAKGFGSDDLFGARQKESSMFESMCKMLPEQVTQRVDCLAVSTEPEEVIEARSADPVTAQHTVGASLESGKEKIKEVSSSRSQRLIFQATAVNRSMEGRWVPTYMRQQLAAGGHTALPSAPNGHEFSATSQPPSCGQAFVDMGQDFSEGAQAVLEFMAAFFTSLTFQCQACGQHAISTAHEQALWRLPAVCGYEHLLKFR
ncbi:unnamed protein product [Effrenium voratum]|nr:unnamed protein product [Effrenium voratum]